MNIKLSQIKVNGRLRKNLQDIKSIADSIQENGLIQPIVVNEQYELIAGQRRLEAAKLLGWKEVPIAFNNPPIDPIFAEFAENNDRVIFTMTERYDAIQRIKKLRADQSKMNGVQFAHPSIKGKKSRDIVARLNKRGIRSQAKESYIINTSKKYPQFAKLVEDVDNNKTSVDTAYKSIKREVWKVEQLKRAASLTNEFLASPDQCKLLEGDFREMSKNIKNDSIPLIFTDPPYKDENIWMYEPLGAIAARVLRPGGSLITYINQLKLFEIGDMLRAALKYWGPFYIKLAGPTFPKLYDHHFSVKVKMLLWFVKGNRPINPSFPADKKDRKMYLEDWINSTNPKKGFHDWGQSPIEAGYCIDKLTLQNDLVFDPFLGEGTTAKAAMKLHRRFIGIDIDPEAIKGTRANLLID